MPHCKTLLIGAGGQIGQLLIPQLQTQAIDTVAMLRNPDKAIALQQAGIKTVIADLEDDFGAAYQDCEYVIFSAGSGANTSAEKTLLIDLWAARRAIDYAKEYAIKHFVMVSSRGADNPDNGPVAIKPYLVAKHFADEYLIASGLNYTILRPGRLIDEAATGLIKTNRPTAATEQIISRADTATAIAYCLNNTFCINKTYELFSGSIPIAEALC